MNTNTSNYTIERTKSDKERTWFLTIDGIKFGQAEVVHLTDTLRSVVATFEAFTADGFKPITVSYDCNKVKARVAYSINNFIDDIMEAIGDKEIFIPRVLDDNVMGQVIVPEDVTLQNTREAAEVLKLDVDADLDVARVQVINHLADNKAKHLDMPMFDLVQKSKLGRTRATAVHHHMAW